MGVVKNLIVRIGADARGLVSGMNTSSNATSRASEKMKKSTTDLKNTTRQNFGDAKKSVREYSQYVANLKQSHQTATQSIPMLKDKLSQMESVFQSVKTATAGLDLSKPLDAQIAEAENNLVKIEGKARKVEQQIAALGNSHNKGSSAKMTALQNELNMLGEKSKYAQLRLEHLNQVADSLGSVHIGFASDAGLKTLAADISAVKNQLAVTETKARETGQTLRSMGVSPVLKLILRSIGKEAANAASGGVKSLWQGLKNIAGTAVKGIASLPGRLLGIGKSASSGAGGISKLVRSIRNIGIVSLGLRVASGLFGQLRSIISSYVSQNDTLNASVTSLKNQLGEALAPAINMVIALMQKLMPVVTSVANAINAVFTALFGNVTATTAGIQASASAAGSAASSLETYGFDQITKVSEPSGGGGTTSSSEKQEIAEQSAIIKKLTGWITDLKEAFKKGDWRGVGEILGEGVNGALEYASTLDFGPKAKVLVENIASAIGGFFSTVDWGGIVNGLIGGISGALNTASDWLAETSFAKMGADLVEAAKNGFYIDWGGLFKSVFRSIASALGALAELIVGTFVSAIDEALTYWHGKIEDAGGDVVQGLLDGAKEGWSAIGTWIMDNICDPFVEGFKEAFDIHSPSRLMESLGKLLMDGLFKGLTENWNKILSSISGWASDIKEKFAGAWEDCKQTVSKIWAEITGTVKTNASEISKVSTEAFRVVEDAISSSLAGGRKKANSEMASLQSETAQKWEAIRKDAEKSAGDISSGVEQGFGNMKTGVLNVFEGMYSGIKPWINTIIGGTETMVNTVIAGINSLLANFNNKSLVSLVDVFAGVNIGLTAALQTISLPRLAEGTIVDGPTAAIIGENGKEAVMPLENHTGWIDNLADRISAHNGGTGVPVILQIYIGKRKLTDYVIEDINKITDTTGVCPIRV